jgi:hypothetical protein
MIKDGLSPEINTIDDFIAEAKRHESAKKCWTITIRQQ